ncbi:hypothetical protein [uncultured Thomasclavelia sp.]|uniref:hypothetical protein n=1 Tax=uncultured Thomasclavelia sp. TaxID=3025759 RepID=UPI002637F25A|nr:hypothetical protein [uncultured Thomasclavelia sp.]
MKKRKENSYESPRMTFVKTELFEDVAAECWAKPSLYCLVDPTDEDECGHAKYADLINCTIEGNGCNNNTKKQLVDYLTKTYGPASGKTHYLTPNDINTIMASGGGNDGTSLSESQYIDQVRS